MLRLAGDLVELWRRPLADPRRCRCPILVGPLRITAVIRSAAQQRPVPATGVGLAIAPAPPQGGYAGRRRPGRFDSEVGQEELQHRRVSGLARGQRDHQGVLRPSTS